MNSWLMIDCALRTTAVLVEATGSGHRIVARGEARTTLDPEGDVTLGVLAAVRQLEESAERQLLRYGDQPGILCPRDAQGNGVDQVLVTSSVGGGLQMMVAGLVRIMTADSAERAALGAGANVLDVIAIDDGRMPHERIQRMRELRPDMFLFGGGVDQGNQSDVLEFAREIAQAGLTSMPVVYAGNVTARSQVQEILGDNFELHMVENMRPVLEDEVLEPTRQKIHELYMQHVISRAPGFAQLGEWASRPITPSTGAVSHLMETVATESGKNLLAISVWDSTIDVFSVFDGRFTRTVSADLGLGYSIANVAVKAGRQNLLRWLPFERSDDELMDWLRNRMLQPAARPADEEGLLIQQAAVREGMRMALSQHKRRATALRGVRQERDISAIFNQVGRDVTIVDMNSLHLVVASASVFAWADDAANARVLLDALHLEGLTWLAIDQLLTAPHFGALASVDPKIGYQVFTQESLRHLGVAVCPVGEMDATGASLTVTVADGEQSRFAPGELAFLPVEAGATVVLQPHGGLDIGAGRGRSRRLDMGPTACGLIVDLRKKVQA